MARKLSRYSLLLIGVGALALSVSWGSLFFSDSGIKAESERISRIFEGKESLIRAGMKQLSDQLISGVKVRQLWKKTTKEDTEKQGLFYTISVEDSLAYWSSSLVAFDSKPLKIGEEGMLKRMPTGWFYIFSTRVREYSITGYMLIKRDFPYQNRYVQSAFQSDFQLSDQCDLVPSEQPGNIQVFCHGGKFHFGIHFKEKSGGSNGETIPEFLFFLLFVILISSHFSKWISGRKMLPIAQFALSVAFAAFFYLLLNYAKFPDEVYGNKLFAPFHFAWAGILSSLGDYLLLSYFLFFVAQSFFILFRRARNLPPLASLKNFLYLFVSCYFAGATSLFLLLLHNSDISLELYSNFSLSLPNILASSCIALQMVGLGIILVRIKCTQRSGKSNFDFFIPAIVSLSLLLLLLLLFGVTIPVAAVLSYLVILFLLDRTSLELLARYKLTALFVYGLILAFGLNLVGQNELEKKRAGIQQVLAVNLATERDPAAEIFLSDFEAKVVKDTAIGSLITPPYLKLENYLKENYFTGFWNNYELQVTVCTPTDSVYLTDERKRYPCFDFFSQLKLTKGVILPGSDFYFMDRLNGRISYLGELKLIDHSGKKPVMAFVELNSKIIPEGKGYPQLLMDQQAIKRTRSDGYSFAKYFDGKLVDRGGSFSYDPFLSAEAASGKEFAYFERGGFHHCVYRRSATNYVVVSYPIATTVEKGRGFPPLFLLIYLLGFGWILLGQRMKLLPGNRLELRGKIQFTMVSTLLILLFLIGLGLIQYNYLEFQRSLKETLDQKVRAISAELGLRIGNAARLDSIHDFLGDQLEEISDITWTDINVYNLKGKLAASSRNEIFDQGLTSGRMNPQAFLAMCLQGNATFLHSENLGKMEFYSVYAPLFNRADDMVGYVNLPYFNRQDDFTKQVTGFIVAFLNLYILLVLLTMIVALLISTKLTVPLLLIEQKLKGIALGKQNARIDYQGEDEIGRLVAAYNKKVGELAESADLLARSERESAWKEMARQIAHEINNPLTPMKLNIQYLQKMKEEDSVNFSDYFNRVTQMLVAQIDALSSIASAFSDFARMPSTHIEPIEMVGLIREIATLFDAPEAYSLTVGYPDRPVVFVSGDRDQMRRALVNIIRNATQALPHQITASIRILAAVEGNQLLIAIHDNGSGIPEADRERLFEPNFTTKSSGMGLGLAITKSILENYGGTISFQSTDGETVFSVALPLSGE